MITMIKLINISIISPSYDLREGKNTRSTLFQVYNMLLSVTVIVLYITSPELFNPCN